MGNVPPCRDQSLADGFETAYAVLRSQFLAYCGTALTEAATWQAAEAALVAIRCTEATNPNLAPYLNYPLRVAGLLQKDSR